ncbi:MAG: flagellar biosynthesis protein FliQ [Candidatus Tectimicrobiota bacterium]
MTSDHFIALAMQTLNTAILLAAPALLVGLIVGVLVSMFQAVTQMQEQTLVLVPKILAVALVLLICLPWMLQVLLTFTTTLFAQLPEFVR